MEKIKSNAQLIFAFSIICLAMAIVYFALELSAFRTDFPDILTQMENTSKVIYPTVNGIAKIGDNVPLIADEIDKVREIMPSILEEVKATRKSMPGALEKIHIIMKQVEETRKVLPEIIEEVRQTREMIPGILEEIHGLKEQIPPIVKEIKKIQKQLPDTLETIDKASESVYAFSTELGKTRQLVPDILKEVKQTREAMPEILNHAERIVVQGQKFGADAGTGAVNGLIRGILNPLNITTRLKELVLPGHDIATLNDTDIELMRKTTIETVENKNVGTIAKWNNPKSKNHGTITVLKKFFKDAAECKEIRTQIWINKEKTHDFNVIFCRQKDGTWFEK